ncbi:MAG: YidC/Oxa1 family insertase periplasmic-domain containing protein [Verrucomicrobiae bacterium]|nr:YidC/Oxa1 family insertase periplasmic-domain containing protein [Verrucomicrobiae bacterium]
MDRRSLLLLTATCLLLVLWYPLMYRIYPPRPVITPTQPGSTTPALDGHLAPSGDLVAPSTLQPASPLRPGYADTGFRRSIGPVTEIVLENDEARYVFTSDGGGLKEVELKHFEDAIVCRERNRNVPVGSARMNRWASTPMFALLGVDPPGTQPAYDLIRSNDVVVARRDLGGDLRVIKEFRLGTNHVLNVTTRLQNWSAQTRDVPTQEWVFGTAGPLHPDENVMYLGLFENDGESNEHIGESWFANRTLGCFPGTPRSEYLGQRTNTVWAAVHNQFFATVVLPADRSARVFARHVDLPVTNGVPTRAPLPGYQAALLYRGEQLPPGQERVREFALYVGPKDYRTLSSLGNNADVVMGFDNYFGGRFSGFFARALLLAMNGLHALGLSYAFAIIGITVLVRLLFWPLMAASARTSKRMAALQPQIKELQEKYKDNPQKMNQKMLELWREHKINPASGCLPILIQFPILLGFYAMLQTAIELRGATFLWACDLSQPDTIAILPGLRFPINPLPLLMGATMLWQARITPMSPSMDATQQKILKYMPLMFMVFLYNFSAGLTLYWTVSNLLSILQMKLTRARDGKSPTLPTLPTAPQRPPGRRPNP